MSRDEKEVAVSTGHWSLITVFRRRHEKEEGRAERVGTNTTRDLNTRFALALK